MNPEDLVSLPGRRWIVVSEMSHAAPGSGESAPAAGRVSAIRTADLERVPLFPTAADPLGGDSRDVAPVVWGSADCPGPPDEASFLPHGIDVRVDRAGRPILAVVNHGGREAVELFELSTTRRPRARWRGCVPMPEGMMMNDVALLPDGGFVVTHFTTDLSEAGLATIVTFVRLQLRADTGAVYRWQPNEGLALIEGSEGSAPNGIAVSRDGTEIFVSEWRGNGVYRIRLDEGEGRPVRVDVALGHSPDNLTWTRDGRLLVAGQEGGLLEVVACGAIEEGLCRLPHSVYAIDPVSLEAERLFEGEGGASVALAVGPEIWVGTFAGDRIVRVEATR